jgi:hypothetical protein
MSTQNDIIGAMKQQTPGPSLRALIASGVATSTAAIRYDRSTSTRDVASCLKCAKSGRSMERAAERQRL